MTYGIKQYASAAELQQSAAETVVRFIRRALLERSSASVLLSGGTTPKGVYERLAAESDVSGVDWKRIHFFWGDERCVPPSHPDSNFRMTDESLLKKLRLPPANIHRIQAERPPHEAALLYEDEIKSFFGLHSGEPPMFDVALLGLGEDGHTASLFPETSILSETVRLAEEVFVPKLGTYRVSVTYPVINNSGHVMFLVSGLGKAPILREVLEGPPGRYPAQGVSPLSGSLCWFVDQDAASMLQVRRQIETIPRDKQ